MSTMRISAAMLIVACYVTACGASEKPAANQAAAPTAEAHDHDHAGHDHDHDHGHPEAKLLPAEDPEGGNPHAAPGHFIVSVNGNKLGHDQLEAMAQQMLGSQLAQVPPQMRQQFVQQLMPRVQAQAIDRFIAGEVLEAEADKQKLTAPEESVTERLDAFRKQLPPSVTWEQALQQMGTTEADIRSEIGREIKIRALIDKHLDSLPKPDTAALKAVYDKDPEKYATKTSASARHVLLTTKDDDDAAKAEKLARIKKLRQEIIDGADFAEIAKGNSDCPSKARGGDLGTFGKGQMVPPFEKAVFEQELNKVGDVVETSFGYHLIEVTAREDARQRTFEEVQDEIAAEMNRERDNNAVGSFVEALRSEAKIVYGEGHEPQAAPAQP